VKECILEKIKLLCTDTVFCSSTLTAVIELWQLLAAVVLVKCGRLSQPKLAFSARYNIVILTYLLTYLLELDYLT